jgi:DNA-binding CsgD family transcriptional regulator
VVEVPEAEPPAPFMFPASPRPAAMARQRLRLCSVLFARGQVGEARSEAGAVLATPHLPPAWQSSARLALLLALTTQGDVAGLRREAEAILAGDDADADGALGGAFTALGYVAWQDGRVVDAIGLLGAAARRDAGRGSNGPRSYPRLGLARMLTAVGEFDRAEAVIEECRDEIERSGDVLWSPAPSLARARLDLAAGRLDAAVVQAEAARSEIENLATPCFTPMAELTLAEAALVGGDLGVASEHARRMRATVPPAPGGEISATSYVWLEARLLGLQEGCGPALEAAGPIYDGLIDDRRLLLDEPDAAVWLVRTAQAGGDVRRAEQVVDLAEVLTVENPDVERLAATAAHSRGLLDGNPDRLVSAASGHRHPWNAASAHEDLGVALGHRDPDACRTNFEQAAAGYEAIGAELDAQRVRGRLGRVGRAGRRRRRHERPVSGWPSLTDTEREVAGHVAQGMTNRQVGERMYLSRHTIDFHLRGVFRKLAVASRVELTRLVLDRSGRVG